MLGTSVCKTAESRLISEEAILTQAFLCVWPHYWAAFKVGHYENALSNNSNRHKLRKTIYDQEKGS